MRLYDGDNEICNFGQFRGGVGIEENSKDFALLFEKDGRVITMLLDARETRLILNGLEEVVKQVLAQQTESEESEDGYIIHDD